MHQQHTSKMSSNSDFGLTLGAPLLPELASAATVDGICSVGDGMCAYMYAHVCARAPAGCVRVSSRLLSFACLCCPHRSLLLLDGVAWRRLYASGTRWCWWLPPCLREGTVRLGVPRSHHAHTAVFAHTTCACKQGRRPSSPCRMPACIDRRWVYMQSTSLPPWRVLVFFICQKQCSLGSRGILVRTQLSM